MEGIDPRTVMWIKEELCFVNGYNPPMEKLQSRSVVVKRMLADEAGADEVAGTPEECLNMMWQLAVDAWAFMGVDVAESEFQRHIVHIRRPEG
jgi:hypothetical protein